MSRKEEIIKALSDGVLEMEEDVVADLSNEYISLGYPVEEAITEGLIDGMNRAGVLYDEEEYFITDILLCSDAMYAGLDIMKPYMEDKSSESNKIKAVIGVVEGDTHDIGKNLVKIMMETAGFEMIDLGRDVSAETFIDTVKKENAELLCMSTLMTTTMSGMSDVIKKLNEEGIREKVKIMIGGGPVSKRFADEIGADGYSSNAVEAVKLANSLIK
ncbi:cobalamin-binding protein [Peptacetobacter hominis]|uniref:Cobalamin-binding protein n=1 Tax=Peptacetobacter hominis TaxID=2743610 RepID=A0A544QW46_9FIRM|nr:corrinoid protein [Peptacetobacter hominis]TQQ84918.1 cobalamin-binding protein [Peptacetobacter hominis]